MTETNWILRASKLDYSVYNIVDGKRCTVSGTEHIEKRAARDGALLNIAGEGAREDVDDAVTAARTAFEERRWCDTSVYKRASVLRKLADLLEVHKEEFALYESMDVGKPVASALAGDLIWSQAGFREAADLADKLYGAAGVDAGCFTYQLLKPIGVTAIITGWNSPLVLASQQLGAALATGNSVVIKPSELTSLSTWRLAELALEAGVPPGVLNVVHGSGEVVGDALARHMGVRMLSFVGSTETGKRLMVAAGESNMKRLKLECGGKSPYLIFDDYTGDLDTLVADLLLPAAFANQGAVCVASTRILLQRGIRDAVIDKLVEQTRAIQPADPLDSKTTFGALVNEAHLKKVLGYVQDGKSQGGHLLYGGERVRDETGGFYMTPAVFGGLAADSRVAKEEIFGPVISCFTFDSEHEAIALANNSEYGLAAYAVTGNGARLHRLGRDLDAGLVTLAGGSDSASGGHFFGAEPHKQSGFGFHGGSVGLKGFMRATHVSVRY